MSKIHETFKNLHSGAVNATRLLLEQDLWGGTPEDTLEHLQNWCDVVANVYDVPPVRIHLMDIRSAGGVEGGGVGDDDIIALTRPSIVWLFHQFRHHMQDNGKGLYADPEIDAVGWAMSLLWKSNPKHMRMLVSEGCSNLLRPEDLIIPPEPEDTSLSEDEQRLFDEAAESFMEDVEDGSELAQLLEQIAGDDTCG